MFSILPQLLAFMTAATPLASCQDAETELSNGAKVYTVSTGRQDDQRDPNATISASRKNAITNAVAKASPAVVGINVTEVRQERVSPFFGDPFFDQFFRDQGRIRQRQVKGLGSGFLISKDGYIITNDHVAGNATE
ncbi:MAG TPA: 2-alkenal reductase, partial [Candidatus Kapabacteria bacterium]|nr:2-alkenal reductase [Candidatus Kapabacteria bacterium]